ncbi:MAG TPA: hypothetical protein VKL19_14590 [Thermoanaerobaculia bacterium]|nr:hypothetical protein [Thermoanaerobaculia bacterium]
MRRDRARTLRHVGVLLFAASFVSFVVARLWLTHQDARQAVQHAAPAAAPRARLQEHPEAPTVAVVNDPPPVTEPRVRKLRLAIVLCKFQDKPAETRPPRFYEDYFTRPGTGGMADYWRDVTLGTVDLSASEVHGWFTMSHDSSEVLRLVFPGGRHTLVQWGKDTAAVHGIDLGKYDGVIVVQNWGVDHGDAGNGVVIVDQNVDLIESTFIAHEMGHLFGLPHSFGENVSPCISASGEYCDAWDIMSAMNVFAYPGTFQGVHGIFGPGLNTFALRALGGLRDGRLLVIQRHNFSEPVELSPLNQQVQSGSLYAVEIKPDDSSSSMYTIEYRHKAVWDQGLPSDAVLIHEEKNLRSYLKRVLLVGDHYSTPALNIEVVSIDAVSQKAIVRIGTNY